VRRPRASVDDPYRDGGSAGRADQHIGPARLGRLVVGDVHCRDHQVVRRPVRAGAAAVTSGIGEECPCPLRARATSRHSVLRCPHARPSGSPTRPSGSRLPQETRRLPPRRSFLGDRCPARKGSEEHRIRRQPFPFRAATWGRTNHGERSQLRHATPVHALRSGANVSPDDPITTEQPMPRGRTHRRNRTRRRIVAGAVAALVAGATASSLMKTAGVRQLRFPGGSYADAYQSRAEGGGSSHAVWRLASRLCIGGGPAWFGVSAGLFGPRRCRGGVRRSSGRRG
jgi:hypothetical protein